MTNPDVAVSALIDLMRLEREAILAGDFSEIEGFAARKSALLESIAGAKPERLRYAKRAASENLQLLDAALKGVRSAQQRLNLILKAQSGFNSYDTRGRSRGIGPGSSTVEKRA